MVATFNEQGHLMLKNLGARGLFTAMLVALATVELYNFCKKRNLTIRMPEGVPDFVSQSFELIPVTLIVGLPCGSDPLQPLATIGSNDNLSAPILKHSLYIIPTNSFSVIPTLI